jgi:phosphatidate cytidylyltransferase
MAQPPDSAKRSSLGVRVISALVLAPIVLGVVWIGGWGLATLTAAAAVLMSLEWLRLTGTERPLWGGAVMIAAALAAILATARGEAGVAVALLGAAALAMTAVSFAERKQAWIAAGILYLGLPSVALIWLREPDSEGRQTVLWVLALVWGIDIGAYFVGRTLKGAKLAPRISPNKTWSGLCGGIVAAVAVGLGTAALSGARPLWLATLSGALAIVEQAGDLMESAIKRHFQVKDAGDLIPGHGGLLDRVDGLIAILVTVAALAVVFGGSPISWR